MLQVLRELGKALGRPPLAPTQAGPAGVDGDQRTGPARATPTTIGARFGRDAALAQK